MAKIASIFYPDCEYPNFYFEENELMSSLIIQLNAQEMYVFIKTLELVKIAK